LLLRRRVTNACVRAVNTVNDTVTIGALVLVSGAGRNSNDCTAGRSIP
jgi:nitrate reductase gamma subunit